MTQPRILVVEDHRDLNDILCRIVASEGYGSERAFTGRQALELLRDRGPFDLILLDIMLPDPEAKPGAGVDGLEVCRRIKSDPALAETLVFLVTVKDQPDDIMRGIEAGADDYITKPFNTTLLLAKVKAMLRIRQLLREVKAKNARLTEIATTDDLTGIPNHRFLMEKLEEEVRRSRRYGSPLSLLMIDLDDFKAINDQFGHQHGDIVLRETAQAILRGIRVTDVLARYGGDEFAVLLPQTDGTGARRVGEEILARLANPLKAGTRDHLVRASVGAATFTSPDTEGADDLISLADTGLYRAKELGGNRVFDPSEGK